MEKSCCLVSKMSLTLNLQTAKYQPFLDKGETKLSLESLYQRRKFDGFLIFCAYFIKLLSLSGHHFKQYGGWSWHMNSVESLVSPIHIITYKSVHNYDCMTEIAYIYIERHIDMNQTLYWLVVWGWGSWSTKI